MFFFPKDDIWVEEGMVGKSWKSQSVQRSWGRNVLRGVKSRCEPDMTAGGRPREHVSTEQRGELQRTRKGVPENRTQSSGGGQSVFSVMVARNLLSETHPQTGQDKDGRGVQKTETTEEVTSLQKLSERARVDRLCCDMNRDFLRE